MKLNLVNEPLAAALDRHTTRAAAELCRPEGERIRCVACGHRCLIAEGQRGICKVRHVAEGQLRVPFGYVAGLQSDPVEKKPFFHVLPGSDALTFGMMGCDLHCAYCQNWVTSQALRDASASVPIRPTSPGQLVEVARRERSKIVVSSYNEPLITAEWAVAVFREAKKAGLPCAFVSNGNATAEVLDFLRPWIVAYKIDLKTFDDRNYRKLGGTLANILDTIQMVHERGIWLEIVTLTIPGFNDSPGELKGIAKFLASVSRDIPWHVTAFHKDYRMTDPDGTPPETLMRAAEIGAEAGLRFVYAGNLPGRVGPWENTVCPSCRTPVIERYGFLVREYRLGENGACLKCGNRLPGIWPSSSGEVRTGNDARAYQGRMPRPVPIASPIGAGALDVESTIPSPIVPVPTMTARESELLIETVGRMLRAASYGERPVFGTEGGQLRDRLVAGAFVSLKRGGHLRSCCGVLGPLIPLHQALVRAVDSTVWDDERFPPVSPSELEFLDTEIWLLYQPEPVQEQGDDRYRAVTIGKHGVKVMRGRSSALFLPSVAVDNHWDARRLLDRVCVKAGLPATAWKDDDTDLYVFEGESLHASLAPVVGAGPGQDWVGPCRADELPALLERTGFNLGALMRGGTPHPFASPDGTLAGVGLFLEMPGSREVRHFLRLVMRPGVPLQATLFALAQSAAQFLSASGISADVAVRLPLGILLLHDPVFHGTVADPHLAGFDPKSRALLVVERDKVGLVGDPGSTPEDVLREAVRHARVSEPASTPVYSLRALTNVPKISIAVAPNPVVGPTVRPPAVAGKFYPADAGELGRMVDQCLTSEAPGSPVVCGGAMVPHAGLRYSGHIAAKVLKRLRFPSTVIVLGPKHTPLGVEWAVAPHEAWAIPGGTVASDPDLARRLCQAVPGLELDAAAHQREHAIEVELPFLARLAPGSKVVGIVLGHGNLERCRMFARGLARVLRELPERPLLLISSDMNHFANEAETHRLDAMALAALDRGDAEELLDTVTQHSISMCGVIPAAIVLETLRMLGEPAVGTRIGYATSADVTGDPSRVVGYAGMQFR